VSDAFGKRGRKIMIELLVKLPARTEQALRRILDRLDRVARISKRSKQK
jgi:hypothetical protein